LAFKASLREGHIPESQKMTPQLKKVSAVACVSKLVERVEVKQLTDYWTFAAIAVSVQAPPFYRDRLLKVLSDIMTAADNKKVT